MSTPVLHPAARLCSVPGFASHGFPRAEPGRKGRDKASAGANEFRAVERAAAVGRARVHARGVFSQVRLGWAATKRGCDSSPGGAHKRTVGRSTEAQRGRKVGAHRLRQGESKDASSCEGRLGGKGSKGRASAKRELEREREQTDSGARGAESRKNSEAGKASYMAARRRGWRSSRSRRVRASGPRGARLQALRRLTGASALGGGPLA